MTQMLSPILASVADTGGLHVAFYCPGCKEPHSIPVSESNGPRWGYNGDPNAPTFTPSILIRSGHFAPYWKEGDSCWCTYNREDGVENKAPFACGVCHSFVTNGAIQFLNDCTHALAGQTVQIPDYPRKETDK